MALTIILGGSSSWTLSNIRLFKLLSSSSSSWSRIVFFLSYYKDPLAVLRELIEQTDKSFAGTFSTICYSWSKIFNIDLVMIGNLGDSCLDFLKIHDSSGFPTICKSFNFCQFISTKLL